MKYEKPEIEIVLFDEKNIALTLDSMSTPGGDGDIISPDDGEVTDANSL